MEIDILENEQIDDLEFNNLKIIQKKDGFRFGMDSVLISNFVKIRRKDAMVADLGTGTGIISILVAAKNEVSKIYGFEIQKEIAEMARRSVALNNMVDIVDIKNMDLVGLSKTEFSGRFDVVITNPPYKKSNTGLKNKNESKLISIHEIKCTLSDIIYESSKILKEYGILYMVHRPDRLVDIIDLMRKNRIEPKEIQMVYPNKNEEANLVLIKAVRLGKSYLKVLKPLIVYDQNGNYTKELLEMYGKNDVKSSE